MTITSKGDHKFFWKTENTDVALYPGNSLQLALHLGDILADLLRNLEACGASSLLIEVLKATTPWEFVAWIWKTSHLLPVFN